jgi:hypothetical protein
VKSGNRVKEKVTTLYPITQLPDRDLRFYATGNYSDAVHDVQRQELLHYEEPEDNAGSSGDEQVLPEVPQAHAA